MVIVDTDTKTLIHSVPVGRYPFGICLSPDEKKVYVANVGMFQYAFIKDGSGEDAKSKPIDYPAFAYGSEEMEEGIENDTISIPGLGDPNAIEAFSVFAVNIEDPAKPEVVAKIKTGHLVGALVEGYSGRGRFKSQFNCGNR